MILKKLQEALAEAAGHRERLHSELRHLESIEAELRSMISRLTYSQENNQLPMQFAAGTAVSAMAVRSNEEKDKIDEVVDILRDVGRPMHIVAICEQLSILKDKEIDRTQVEPGLNRHVAKTKSPKLVKTGPSTFGLPEWQVEPKPLAHAS